MERQKAASEYLAALAPRLSPSLRAGFLLEGVEQMHCVNGAVQDELLRRLSSSSHKPDSGHLARAWQLIRDGKIAATPAWLSCDALVEHALTSLTRHKDDGDGDEDSDAKNPEVTPAEAFFVLLAFASNETHDRAIALRISQECDARLRYQPTAAPTRILDGGELLGRIGTIRRDLSPAIRHRREIGVAFDNSVHEYHRYDPVTAPEFERLCVYLGSGSTLSVELPHLVYALVDRVEVDVVASATYGVPEIRYASPGAEVLLRPFTRKELPPRVASAVEVITVASVVKPDACAVPCTHVSISLDRTTTVVAVRLYGRAIVF